MVFPSLGTTSHGGHVSDVHYEEGMVAIVFVIVVLWMLDREDGIVMAMK